MDVPPSTGRFKGLVSAVGAGLFLIDISGQTWSLGRVCAFASDVNNVKLAATGVQTVMMSLRFCCKTRNDTQKENQGHIGLQKTLPVNNLSAAAVKLAFPFTVCGELQATQALFQYLPATATPRSSTQHVARRALMSYGFGSFHWAAAHVFSMAGAFCAGVMVYGFRAANVDVPGWQVRIP